ncbi:mutator type transposase [Tanacetum coccineum]
MAGALHQHLASLTLVDRLGLDYGLHPLNVDVDVLEMANYVKDYKIILMYVEHESSNVDTSIFVAPKKEVAIAVDSNPDVNRNLTPICHRNLKKEWEQVSSKSLSIGEVMKNLSKKQPASSVEGPIVVESANDPFKDLDEILVNDVLDLQMLFETKGVGPIGKFNEVEIDAYNESEEKSDIEGNDTSGSDSEDLDYDLNHDQVFDDDEHIVEDVHHQQTKHIEIDIHFVRDMVARGQVCVLHVPSRYEYADIFTKGLPSTLFEEFRTSLSVRLSPAQTAGGAFGIGFYMFYSCLLATVVKPVERVTPRTHDSVGGIILLILGGFAWYYTHVYIEDGVTFIAKSSVTFLAKRSTDVVVLVLRVEKKMFIIEQPLPAAPAADSDAQVLSQWNAIYDAYNEVACLILGSMTPELYRQFENFSPYDMIKELKAMFEKQAGVERFDLI